MIPFSVLDLAPIPEGATAADALRNTLDLARHAEGWGYHRYWLAEHHNMPGIASAATSVLIGQVGAVTSRIRVGSGGIMLPNHAPLVIAEQFGTLATLFPGRVDLGLGRAPGTDMTTTRALRRSLEGADNFPQDVLELIDYLAPAQPNRLVRAIPGEGTEVPVWILGSSLYGAQLAAHLGLPFAFASHFAPAALEQATAIYRASFQPSERWPRPHFMLAVNVFAAASDAEGRRLRSSMLQAFVNLRTGRAGPLPSPRDDLDRHIEPWALAGAEEALRIHATGAPTTVRQALKALIADHTPDELILTGQIHDHTARLRSFELAAEILREMA